jgi:hypothetical protein
MENDLRSINTGEDFVPGPQIENANQRVRQSHYAFRAYLQPIDLLFHVTPLLLNRNLASLFILQQSHLPGRIAMSISDVRLFRPVVQEPKR